jgi:hypothetical protein
MVSSAIMVAIIVITATMPAPMDVARTGILTVVMTIDGGQRQRHDGAQPTADALSRMSAAPSCDCDDAPDRLDDPERPCALQEAVGGPEPAGNREAQHPPGRATLKSVADQHGDDGEEAEGRESAHS